MEVFPAFDVVLKPPFWIISDTHWYHRKIIHIARRPYDWDKMLVKRWRHLVGEDDVVLHLGDLVFGYQKGFQRYAEEIMPQLPGRKYLILGNHDKRSYDFRLLGYTPINPFEVRYRDHTVSFNHYPRLISANNRKSLHVHGHLHRNLYSHGLPTRHGNINVSLEVMGYQPQPITQVLNTAIRQRKGKRPYLNKKSRRLR